MSPVYYQKSHCVNILCKHPSSTLQYCRNINRFSELIFSIWPSPIWANGGEGWCRRWFLVKSGDCCSESELFENCKCTAVSKSNHVSTHCSEQTDTHWEAVLSWRTTSAERTFISKIIYIMVSWNFYFMLWFVYCVLSIIDYNMFLQPTNNIAVRRSRRTPLWQIQAQYQESSSALW